ARRAARRGPSPGSEYAAPSPCRLPLSRLGRARTGDVGRVRPGRGRARSPGPPRGHRRISFGRYRWLTHRAGGTAYVTTEAANTVPATTVTVGHGGLLLVVGVPSGTTRTRQNPADRRRKKSRTDVADPPRRTVV